MGKQGGLEPGSLIPQHIAIIMDGNGRWARQKGRQRLFGHKNGVKAVREVTEGAAEIGVKYLTLFAFSTENWSRPQAEVNALMQLLIRTIHQEVETLRKNGIRLEVIGAMDNLPARTRKAMDQAMALPVDNHRMTLVLALSYSGRWDILQGVKALVHAGKEPDAITEEDLFGAMPGGKFPEPELIIRTSGEYRISNFLLWQAAYSEFYFTPVLWPDFRKEHLLEAVRDYQTRERRFGKTSEQVK